jgi:hypothetical protein
VTFSGLDPRQYGYNILSFTPASDGDFYSIQNRSWLVLRVQAFASSSIGAQSSIQMAGGLMAIEPGGCLDLRPNGLYRGGLVVHVNSGGDPSGLVVIVEYSFAFTENGIAPQPIISS